MQRDIKHNWFFPYAPETVWKYLTQQELIEQWLMKNDFQPAKGHKFNFHTSARPGFDGRVFCEVLEVNPFSKLSYTWKGGPGDGSISLDSVVTWTLTPTNNGTELQLEHNGFKGMKNFLAWFFMNAGWKTKIKNRITELMAANESKVKEHAGS